MMIMIKRHGTRDSNNRPKWRSERVIAYGRLCDLRERESDICCFILDVIHSLIQYISFVLK